MANKKITQLPAASVVALTDLVPIVDDPGGSPATQKATWSQIFEDGSGDPSIERDSRELIDSGGNSVLDWENERADDAMGQPSFNWGARRLQDTLGQEAIEWGNRLGFDNFEVPSYDWDNRFLLDGGGIITSLDWNARVGYDAVGGDSFSYGARMLTDATSTDSVDWDSRIGIDASSQDSINWATRRLIGPDGITTVLDWNTNIPLSTTQQVFDAAGDPNGVVTATKPAICVSDNDTFWRKSNVGTNNTGWVLLLDLS